MLGFVGEQNVYYRAIVRNEFCVWSEVLCLCFVCCSGCEHLMWCDLLFLHPLCRAHTHVHTECKRRKYISSLSLGTYITHTQKREEMIIRPMDFLPLGRTLIKRGVRRRPPPAARRPHQWRRSGGGMSSLFSLALQAVIRFASDELFKCDHQFFISLFVVRGTSHVKMI